jgi:hypothetical protein
MGDYPRLEPVSLWEEFCVIWYAVKWPKGCNRLQEIFERAEASPFPAAADRYADPTYRRLVRLCEQLQIENGEKPWFLTVRAAADLFQVSKATTNRMLQRLVKDGVLEYETREELLPKNRKGRRKLSHFFRFVATASESFAVAS